MMRQRVARDSFCSAVGAAMMSAYMRQAKSYRGGGSCASQARQAATADRDIVETAVSAGSFQTLAKALQAAGLIDALKGAGPFTVFAPTDAAFARLPAGTLDNLLQPQNAERLKAVLTYHVVVGKVLSNQAASLAKATTLQGQPLDFATSEDRSVMVNQARVVRADVTASNGVVHAIDSVLLPK